MILSPIEQSIKQKIEAVGTPLKDWDINIYRGILTGYNEAFIIDGATKDRLIEEDPKSAEIIRPILRGRDIKRYGYEFANLFLITTFPSLKIDIEKFPAVKQHLLSFGMERLEQTGKEYNINGKTIKARKKTNNKWFETQDSISYWEDFYKQKIIWSDISTEPEFVFVDEPLFFNNTCYMMTGAGLGIIGILNSKIMKWYFPKIATDLGSGGTRYFKQFVELLPIPNDKTLLIELEEIIKLSTYNSIDNILYEKYKFSKSEIKIIESQ